MPEITMTISPAVVGGSSSAQSANAVMNMPGPTSMPLFIRADEAYYWSQPWQREARASRQARAKGESMRFDSNDPLDVVRWLLDADDD